MKNTIRHIAIYLLTAMMLVASTGVSVCCMFGCHDVEVLAGQVDCCEEKTEFTNGQQKGNCPDCQAEYISLDTDYLLTSSYFKISLPAIAHKLPALQPLQLLFSGKIPTICEHNLPPPRYGKSLLCFIQTFRC